MDLKLERVIAVRTTKTIYRCEGDKVAKVFDNNFSKVDVLNEALNQARVENLGINVPHILEVTTTDNGEWVIASEYIKGHTLSELMKKNPEKKAEYMKKFVELQLEVQKHTCPLLTKIKDKMNTKIALADLEATTRYELRARLEGLPRDNKLCHGDLCPSNIIVTDDGKYYVLDWSHATQGCPTADAAITYLTFWLNGDIEGAKEYLSLYCELSHTEQKAVQRWLPIVAAAQSTKGNKDQREFLLSWINVAEYE